MVLTSSVGDVAGLRDGAFVGLTDGKAELDGWDEGRELADG